MQTRRYVIMGRVQGVGFRFSTRRTALGLGIDGWVRNRLDGSVEVVARADQQRLEALESFLERGPFGARVDALDREISEEITVEKGFFIGG